MDVHDRIQAEIQEFLQRQAIVNLISDAVTFPDQQYMKAGIIPFVRQESSFHYLFMKPVSKYNAYNPPAFQICKGTRMYLHRGSGWRDMKAGDEGVTDKEALAVTAMREGIEEVGLKLDAITRMLDVGPYKFLSEKTGKSKYMWLFTTELASIDDLLPDQEVARTTAERSWLTAEEFAVVGRADHRYIMEDIAAKLKKHYKE